MARSKEWEAFWKLWRTGRWERETRDLIRETLQPGDLFLDVGAWIGPVTSWALETGAHVIAIEPDPVARAELERRKLKNVEIHACALTPTSGPVKLAPRRGQFGNSMSHIREDGDVEVEGRTYRDVLAGRVPKMVKVDVEGFEAELLTDLAPAAAADRAVLQVALHPHIAPPPAISVFDDFSRTQWPEDPRGNMVAWP